MKVKTFLVILVLSLLCTPAHALNLSRVKTWGSEILTAADLNAEFNNILDHSLTKNDLSATAGILGTQVDFVVAPAIGATTPAAAAFTTLSASGATSLSTTLGVTGETLFSDKASFTQVDDKEYIDSLADGYLDFEATTGLRFRINGTEQINLIDGVLAGTTDSDVSLGSTTKEFKDLWIDGTANIDSLVADAADINGGTLGAITIDGNWTALSQTCANLGAVTTTGAIGLGGTFTGGANTISGTAFDMNGGTLGGVTLDGALTMSLGSDADGDIYYRTSNVLTRLAKGTTSQVLLGGDAPSWGFAPIRFQEFTIAETGNDFTVPTGITKVFITMVAGGGGGGGGRTGTGGGGGGAGGGGIINFPVVVTSEEVITVTIGAAGVYALAEADGGDGGDSSFAADSGTITVSGGQKGLTTSGAGGVGGAGYNMDAGTPYAAGTKQRSGTGGTGDAGGQGGGGGGSILGDGGRGGYGSGVSLYGVIGTGYGAGGGGGGNSNISGAGTAGFCLIKW